MIIIESVDKAQFNTRDTEMSYYNNFLNPKDLKYMQDTKNLTGEIVQMTPEEYYKACANDIFHKPLDYIKKSRQIDDALINKYAKAMKDGEVFPMCMLNYENAGQEGLHRMMAAGETFGWDIKYPVLVVKPYDMNRYEEQKRWEAALDYADYDFKKDVKEVEEQLYNEFDAWTDECPMDILTMIQNKISLLTNEKVEVNVTLEKDRGYWCAKVKLISYDGEDLTNNRDGIIYIDLEDHFDIDEDTFNPDYYF